MNPGKGLKDKRMIFSEREPLKNLLAVLQDMLTGNIKVLLRSKFLEEFTDPCLGRGADDAFQTLHYSSKFFSVPLEVLQGSYFLPDDLLQESDPRFGVGHRDTFKAYARIR